MFCHDQISDLGLGFYEHVEEKQSCFVQWESWMEEIPSDHGGD